MNNVTKYLKERGLYNRKIIHKFLSLQRVKYFIGQDKKVISKSGRYNSYTLFSDDLFKVFIFWLDKKPIPMMNRKEYEISDFICEYYVDAIKQYEIGGYFFDWFIPSKNLFIEFNEKHHSKKSIKEKDFLKSKIIGNSNLFIINEDNSMKDLANLCIKYKIK